MERKRYIEELIDGSRLMRRKTLLLSGLKASDITTAQGAVLGCIFRSEGSTTTDVARELKMTGSAVTQLVNGLVQKGYVVRKRDLIDKRAHRLVLSPKSRKGLIHFLARRKALMLRLFSALNDKEFKQYVELQKKVITSLEKQI